MGLLLAARYLDLDLDRAEVRPGELWIPGRNGGRAIPIDSEGFMYVDWTLLWNDRRLTLDSFENLLGQEIQRSNGKTNLPMAWRNKVVVVGSIGTGNNISDIGITPLSEQTFLMSKHWNVANMVILNRFIHRSAYLTETLLIVLMGVFSGIITWRLRVLHASFLLLTILCGYFILASWLFVVSRYWLPVVLPAVVALMTTHVCLVTYRVLAEQKERHRIRTMFSRLVSPNVVNELLKEKTVSLGGARREVSVYFADIRGFSSVIDENHARAEESVKALGLSPAEAETYLAGQAREILGTVNLYLGMVSDTVKEHDGTFDKYIGDCVMAFWGAPTPNPDHAADAVRAAIDAQRGIHQLNLQRAEENQRRERENVKRAAAGQSPLPLLTLLTLGAGINTGVVTVGLMGSDSNILNYTVFGREVNLASRLEGVSGRGRIVISESTFLELVKRAPDLCERCIELPPISVKGFRNLVKAYEIRWQDGEPGKLVASEAAADSCDGPAQQTAEANAG
jgi:adenylate cyclase